MKNLPQIVGRARLNREVSFALGYWFIPLALLVGYFISLPDAMAAGISPLEFSSIYLSQVSERLSPVTIPLLCILMTYLYMHVVCIPIANSATHQRACDRSAFHAVASLIHQAVRFIGAWWRTVGTAWTRLAAYLTTNPLRICTRGGIPRHLSIGWSPGFSPLVLYG